MNYMIIFWVFFGFVLFVFIANSLIMPMIRKRLDAKATKKQDEAMSKIKKGDTVMLVSGVFGEVISIHKRNFHIEIAKDTIVKVDKQGILGFFPKGKHKLNNKIKK